MFNGIALSVIASQCHLPQSGRQVLALPLGELAEQSDA